MRRARGFSLLEMIVVVVVISVGMVGVARLSNRTSSTLVVNEELAKATRYAQECGERILRLHRNTLSSTLSNVLGFLSTGDANNTLVCPSPPGFTTTVTMSATFLNAENSRCPSIAGLSILCGDVTVKVQSKTMPNANSSVVFMIIQ